MSEKAREVRDLQAPSAPPRPGAPDGPRSSAGVPGGLRPFAAPTSLETFITVDADWRITFVSDSAAGLVGLDPDELIGHDLRDLPSTRRIAPAPAIEEGYVRLRDAMERRVTVGFVVSTDDAGGSLRCTAYPLEDGGLGIHVYDVGDRVRAARELMENEQRLRFHLRNTPLAVVEWDAEFIVTQWAGEAEAVFGWSAADTVGKSIMDLEIVYEDDIPIVEATMEKLTDGRHLQVVGRNRNVTRDGRVIDCIWYNSVLLDERGHMSSVMSLVLDVTEQRQALAAVRGSEVRQTFLLELSDVLRDLADPVAMAEAACTRLGRYLGAAGCGLLEVVDGGDGVRLTSRWTAAEDEAGQPREDVPTMGDADLDRLRSALLGGEVLVTDGALLQPLHRHGRTAVGVVVWGGAGRQWSEQDAALVREAADRAWAFIEAARADRALRESEAAKAAEHERGRLARDLHDSVTQALFAATLRAEALTRAEGASPKVVRGAEEVARLNRGALAQMRALLLELRGEPLEEVPLAQLIEYLAEAARGATSATVHVRVHGGGQMPPAVHLAAYRIAQEALSNVTRHARADNVWLTLELRSRRLALTIEDDGVGFEPADSGPGHMGLRSMQERADELSATLRVDSCPGGGTVVSLEWHGD